MERDWSAVLDLQLRAGEILEWHYERFRIVLTETVVLSSRTSYTPDFVVYLPDGAMEFHEIKGYRRDDAMVKLRVAVSQNPRHQFKLIERKRGSWVISEL